MYKGLHILWVKIIFNANITFVQLLKLLHQLELSANIKVGADNKMPFEYKTTMSDNVMLFHVSELE